MPSPAATERVAPLVGVLVPAFNAAATIDATLGSARRQSHRRLDIVVVDDGSTDATAAVVRRHAEEDSRVRLVQQANQGVAAARNRAAAETDAPLLAPLDADDVWQPEKIERQVAAFAAGGDRGLVYAWSAQIDDRGFVAAFDPPEVVEGDGAAALCRRNFIGNASTPLFSHAAFDRAGGYDTGLRAAGAQGCEDWDLHLKIALDEPVHAVKAYAVGYRITGGTMSRQVLSMWRSYALVRRRMAALRPDLAADLDAGVPDVASWLAGRALIAGEGRAFRQLVMSVAAERPSLALRMLAMLPPAMGRAALPIAARSALRRLLGRSEEHDGVATGRPFIEVSP